MPTPLSIFWFLISVVAAVTCFFLGRRSIHVHTGVHDNSDSITGLPLRDGFEHTLDGLIASSSEFSIALIDVDHFKRVNDEHGHLAGDMILREIASDLESQLARGNSAFRWGGDEFAVIFTQSSEEATHALNTWILRTASQPFTADAATISITCSAGITSWMQGEDQQGTFRRCDQALYEAKRAGRNQVISN
ncbi:MAG: GGDEF domain-containing protein [Pirellulaceae bacterium]